MFTADVSSGGQEILIKAAVLPGNVVLTADRGTFTFAQVLAGAWRPDLPPDFAAEIVAYVRTLVAALEALLAAVRSIGDAMDAADHGQPEAAARIDAAAPARTREAWALAPDALARVLPEDLVAPLSTGTFELMRWYEIASRIESLLR